MMKRLLWQIAKATAAGSVLAALFFGVPFFMDAYGRAGFDPRMLDYPDNTVFYDRQGLLLRFLPNSRGVRRIKAEYGEIPDMLKKAFIAAEDERFYAHGGYDPRAIARAAYDNLRAGRVVSGASTISQQLVRLAYGGRSRCLGDKLVEAIRSARMERLFTKDQILGMYLDRVPLGNNITGVELAARVYFGKTCRDLTTPECALLAALPKAPTTLNPLGGGGDRLDARRDWVLRRMHETGALGEAAYKTALADRPAILGNVCDFRAPHLVDLLISRGGKDIGPCRTTLDLDIQDGVERIIESHRARLGGKGAGQAAVLVVHNKTMEALALAGSMDYGDGVEGNNNGVTALRSAGSTLKPFLYALALERGKTASDTIQDIGRRYRSPKGTYTPANFDRREYGPVTMRLALGSSLNLAAVRTLDQVGCQPFYDTLDRLHLINDRRKGPGYYGLGLAVGNPEVSVEELAAAYASLAGGGEYRPIRYTMDRKAGSPGVRVFEPQTAYIITDILSDPSARSVTFGTGLVMDFPFRVALKTGTSTNFRDCWAVGYTPEYTVAVWTGNFDGSPTGSLTGASGAVPIFQDVIGFLYRGGSPAEFPRPDGVVAARVCGFSGSRPTESCPGSTEELFIAGTEPAGRCGVHRTAERHELPAQYADWVYAKYRRGAASGYRLAGAPDDLDAVFEDTHEDDGPSPVRMRGAGADAAAYAAPGPPKHFSIGPGPDGPDDPGGDGGRAGAGNRLKITYPLDGDRFISAGLRSRTVRMTLMSDRPVGHVDWFVDGWQLRRSGPPYEAYWDLARGRHVVSALDPSGNGDTISIEVE
ncbi:MAG: penicillin-binding protein 1C [Nitrospirae bacterium]|nr:penicillin-binding protein 1C [Nitrospirota bacterium]